MSGTTMQSSTLYLTSRFSKSATSCYNNHPKKILFFFIDQYCIHSQDLELLDESYLVSAKSCFDDRCVLRDQIHTVRCSHSTTVSSSNKRCYNQTSTISLSTAAPQASVLSHFRLRSATTAWASSCCLNSLVPRTHLRSRRPFLLLRMIQ